MTLPCPNCSGEDRSCKICDGLSFVTEKEMKVYLSKTAKEFAVSLPSQKKRNTPKHQKLVLDFSEFNQEK